MNGLTEDQLKVYKDFSKLSYKSKFDQVSPNGTQDGTAFSNADSSQQQNQSMNQKQPAPAQYDFSNDAVLNRLNNDKPLDSVPRSLMTIKLQ